MLAPEFFCYYTLYYDDTSVKRLCGLRLRIREKRENFECPGGKAHEKQTAFYQLSTEDFFHGVDFCDAFDCRFNAVYILGYLPYHEKRCGKQQQEFRGADAENQ